MVVSNPLVGPYLVVGGKVAFGGAPLIRWETCLVS